MNKNIQVRKRNLLHKRGKQWVTIGISAMALLGFNTLYSHASVHASSLNSRLNNAIRLNSNQRMTANTSKNLGATDNFQQRIQANNNLYQHSHVIGHNNNQPNNFIPQKSSVNKNPSINNTNRTIINNRNNNQNSNIQSNIYNDNQNITPNKSITSPNTNTHNVINNQASTLKNTKPSLSFFDSKANTDNQSPQSSNTANNNLVILKKNKSNKENTNKNNLQNVVNVDSHYVYPIRNTTLRKTADSNNGTISVSQQEGFTGKIINRFNYNGNSEYKILWNHQIFYVSSNDVQNVYIQSSELDSHKQGSILPYAKVKMIKPARLYNSVHYNSSTFKKDVHVGQELTVVGIKSFGNPAYHRTRLQLSNGLFVTANKNFVTFA